MKYIIVAACLITLYYISIPLNPSNLDTVTYFTNQNRKTITSYYQKKYQESNCTTLKPINIFCYVKPFRINHSTNLAATYFNAKQKSTYLEEYFYPLRGSIIVNGYEPYNEKGIAFDKNSQPLIDNGQKYFSQVSVIYSQPALPARLLISTLIILCIFWEIKLFKKI